MFITEFAPISPSSMMLHFNLVLGLTSAESRQKVMNVITEFPLNVWFTLQKRHQKPKIRQKVSVL